jgi:hypothetical protein
MRKKTREKIESIVITPGTGEVYATVLVTDENGCSLNIHNKDGQPDAIIAINQIRKEFPKLKNVAVVVDWFVGDTTDNLVVKPRWSTDSAVYPYKWRVGTYTNDNSQKSIYSSGTPADESILSFLKLLKSYKFNLILYPRILVDNETRDWRGEINPEDANAAKLFFDSYNSFINHYAKLSTDYIDGIIIGSELKGLTQGKYSERAITELKHLAYEVQRILKEGSEVTYVANWDEYHRGKDGFFKLDTLWADENIDVVGISCYFPLTNRLNQSDINYNIIKKGWSSGQYYDSNSNSTPLEASYAVKNMGWWWSNYHINPNGLPTDWKPKMKPISCMELGFSSVDATTNEPYKIFDPYRITTKPYASEGKIDKRAQAVALEASLDFLKEQDYIKDSYVYELDLRQYFKSNKNKSMCSDWGDRDKWKYSYSINAPIKENQEFFDFLDLFLITIPLMWLLFFTLMNDK